MAVNGAAVPTATDRGPQPERTFGAWVRVVLRRWPIVLLFVVAGLALGAGYTLTQPTLYSATSTLVLSPQSGVLDPANSQDLPALADTIAGIAVTDPVLLETGRRFTEAADSPAERTRRAGLDLEWLEEHVSSSVLANTSLVEISGRDGRAADADELTAAASASVIDKVESLRGDAAQGGLALATLGEPTGQGQVSPNLTRNLLLGGNLGLVLGILVAALLADRGLRIRGRSDLAQALGVSEIVTLPPPPRRRANAPAERPQGLTVRPDDPLQEPFRLLRSRLAAAAGRGTKTIAVLGAAAPATLRDVASSVGAHLCAAGARTIVVEADFHGSGWASTSPSGGLGTALRNGGNPYVEHLSVAIQRLDADATVPAPLPLAVIPAGPPPADPAAALVSPKIADLLSRLATDYDHVIVVGPSAGWQAESMILSERADATLLVLGGTLSVDQAREVKDSYEASPGRLLAVAVVGGRRT